MNPSPRSSVSRALIAVLAVMALTASALAARNDDLAGTSARLISQAMQQSPVRQALRAESTMFALPSAGSPMGTGVQTLRLASSNAAAADGEARRSDAGEARVDLSFAAQPAGAAAPGTTPSSERPSGLALLLAAVLAILFMARRRGIL